MKPKTARIDYMWETLKWPEIAERLKVVDTAILPCGAIEQHGPHLPLDLDYFDAVYMAKEVAKSLQRPQTLCASADTLWGVLPSQRF